MVTDRHFVFSTSYSRCKRSNLCVVRRDYSNLDKAKLSCFRAPRMSEGITKYHGDAYLVFESGSHLCRKVNRDCKPRNVITHLHKALVSSLKSLVP